MADDTPKVERRLRTGAAAKELGVSGEIVRRWCVDEGAPHEVKPCGTRTECRVNADEVGLWAIDKGKNLPDETVQRLTGGTLPGLAGEPAEHQLAMDALVRRVQEGDLEARLTMMSLHIAKLSVLADKLIRQGSGSQAIQQVVNSLKHMLGEGRQYMTAAREEAVERGLLMERDEARQALAELCAMTRAAWMGLPRQAAEAVVGALSESGVTVPDGQTAERAVSRALAPVVHGELERMSRLARTKAEGLRVQAPEIDIEVGEAA